MLSYTLGFASGGRRRPSGQSCIQPAGEVLDARLLPEKNPDGAAVGWFTTRLSPQGAAAVEVEAPCVM
jgi:hypothetical protein